MTVQKDLKKIIRARQSKTGESYSIAKMHVLSPTNNNLTETNESIEAVVLGVKKASILIQSLKTKEKSLLRTTSLCRYKLVPGYFVKISIEKTWTWKSIQFVTGEILDWKIDLLSLNLEPLKLDDWGLNDESPILSNYDRKDPCYKIIKEATQKPKHTYEFDGIAWGDHLVDKNEELLYVDEDDSDEAKYDFYMKHLEHDLRFIDGHAHLGNLEFEYNLEKSMAHYQMGVEIAELSLAGLGDIFLPWGITFNRPYLRALHGLGLCKWRLGLVSEAENIFVKILKFNPNDNQGARFCLNSIKKGESWEELDD